MNDRVKDTERFYKLIKQLEERVGGRRRLKDCHWNMGWPERGVYFFFEDGETRSDSQHDLRVVRVGTHAVNANSKSHLWNRLYEHKQDGGRSVFRDHVNAALKNRASGSSIERPHNHSRCISRYIGDMSFLWVNVDGDGGHLLRRKIEKNAIALLSCRTKGAVDKPSSAWLGYCSSNDAVKRSGLWNVQHTGSSYVRGFLDLFKSCIDQTEGLAELVPDWDSPMCLSNSN